jgi:hypothetical protein
VPRQETGPWLARHFAAAALCPEHAGDLGFEVSLVASELAKDVMYHAGAPVTLSVDCWGSAVVISLRDTAARDPRVDSQREKLTALMLERLTDGWGMEVDGSGGRTFWCLLPASPTSADHAFAAAGPLKRGA